MHAFDPAREVIGAASILDASGCWPNFHDAEIVSISFWRGDVRPEDQVWIGPRIDATFHLAALEHPFDVVLRFHDCESIAMPEFTGGNAINDLVFRRGARGFLNDGVTPLTPYVVVRLDRPSGIALSFKCMRVEVLERRDAA